jgi:hypothetical protein
MDDKEKIPNDYLIRSIDEAQLLLRYAVKNNIDIDQETIRVIVEAPHLLETSGWKIEFEVSFWNAFKVLTKETLPVTVATLKAVKKCIPETNFIFRFFSPYKTPDAYLSVRLYYIFTLFITVIILVTLFYSIAVSGLIADMNNTTNKIKESETIQDKRKLEIIQSAKEDKVEIDFTNDPVINRTEADKIFLRDSYKNSSVYLCSLQRILDRALSSECDSKTQQPEFNKKLFKTAELSVLAIQSFLPLLYGCLGALVYILRNLALEIKALTYTEELKIHYKLRLILGTVSGLAIGWFYTPDQKDALVVSLSPLALAFLAGYSVEILFATMDRMIAVFSTDKSSKTT